MDGLKGPKFKSVPHTQTHSQPHSHTATQTNRQTARQPDSQKLIQAESQTGTDEKMYTRREYRETENQRILQS